MEFRSKISLSQFLQIGFRMISQPPVHLIQESIKSSLYVPVVSSCSRAQWGTFELLLELVQALLLPSPTTFPGSMCIVNIILYNSLITNAHFKHNHTWLSRLTYLSLWHAYPAATIFIKCIHSRTSPMENINKKHKLSTSSSSAIVIFRIAVLCNRLRSKQTKNLCLS